LEDQVKTSISQEKSDMAYTLDPMNLKQIINLHNDGLSNRQISDVLNISRNTVNTYMHFFNACDYGFDELLKMEEACLEELFSSKTTINNHRFEQLQLYFDRINMARNHPGFTFKFHYNEYKNEVKNPYGYTQFMEHYKRKYAEVKGSLKLEHDPGKELYIDYAGKKLEIINRETGEVIPVEVFVSVLPNSQYTYVEATMSQKREDLLACLGNALSFFGGVPKAIVSDNLKSAVTKASKYEPVINRTFKEFALHYQCAINPTRGYSPQDKALVENAVQIMYQRIYYPLREMEFFSLDDLNREIRKWLEEYNSLLFQRKQASRKELFQSVERGYLKPLPQERFEIKEYCQAKVQKIGCIYFSPDKSYYSVPYRFIGKSTVIGYTKSTVEVYYDNQRIAFHKRNPLIGHYNMDKNHLSSTHRAYTEWSPEYFRKLAANHGNDVLTIIDHIVTNCDYPETSYKRAMGIIQLHRTYGSERLNNACKRALFWGTYSYNHINNMLINSTDKEPLVMEQTCKTHIPGHENIRGASNYK
jgi:transposase